MIKPNCDLCGKELTDFGALLFSPPNEKNEVKKFHICKLCYNTLQKQIKKGNKK